MYLILRKISLIYKFIIRLQLKKKNPAAGISDTIHVLLV